MKPSKIIDEFQRARGDTQLAVVEGVQAIKHAARFKAVFIQVVTCDAVLVGELLDELAPDVKGAVFSNLIEVSEETFLKLSPHPPRTKLIAIAKRKPYSLKTIPTQKPLVLLEDPRDLENIGAVIRVSAAADIAGVCITGPADIWHPAVIRGGAGLHFALPVLNLTAKDIEQLERPLISLDPTGEQFSPKSVPKNAILVFGTERHGISTELLKKSTKIVRLPMRDGVSSLNLATSVAATLYKMC